MKLSEDIARFLKVCEEVRRVYEVNYNIVGECDKKTTDYLHSLELENLTYHERAKLANGQRENLLTRRSAKDLIEGSEPLLEWLETAEAVRALNRLKNVLGATRKVEAYHENRQYKKRSGG